MGRRAHRPAEPAWLAQGHARDRRQGTPAPRRADDHHLSSSGTGSRRSPRTPAPVAPAPSLPTSKSATAAAPAAKTRSASPKTPDSALFRSSTSSRTRSGGPLLPSPSRSPRGREMLALTDHPARRWEPKRLRLRLFTVPATLARTGRRVLLHLAAKAPWAQLAGQGITRMRALAALHRCVIGAADLWSPGATPRRAAPDVSGARARPSGVLKSEAARSSTLRLRDPRAGDLGTLRFRGCPCPATRCGQRPPRPLAAHGARRVQLPGVLLSSSVDLAGGGSSTVKFECVLTKWTERHRRPGPRGTP